MCVCREWREKWPMGHILIGKRLSLQVKAQAKGRDLILNSL